MSLGALQIGQPDVQSRVETSALAQLARLGHTGSGAILIVTKSISWRDYNLYSRQKI